MGFLKSFFTGKSEQAADEQQKSSKKNFEIFKYDGMRAQRMGRIDYAVKCFGEALALNDDFETRGYLAQAYIQCGKLEEAHRELERMTEAEPNHVATYLTLANVCYMQEDYEAMARAARKVIEIEQGNAMAHYLLAKADDGQGNPLMCVAHLTQAIVLKDDFTEARLLRAEALLKMGQLDEATEDIQAVLAGDEENESALLLRGQLAEARGEGHAAEEDYLHIIALNPFNEQAYLALGKHYIASKSLDKAIDLFDEAVELNPNFAAAYHERGRAKLLNGDKEGATEDMKKGLELNPSEIESYNGQFNNQPRQTDILGL